MNQENYTTHTLTAVEYPAYYGLHPDTKGSGLIRATVNATGQRITVIVDASYAAMIRQAKEDSLPDEDAVLAGEAVRWMRLGWPEDWTPGRAPGAWAPVYLLEYSAPVEGGHGLG